MKMRLFRGWSDGCPVGCPLQTDVPGFLSLGTLPLGMTMTFEAKALRCENLEHRC